MQNCTQYKNELHKEHNWFNYWIILLISSLFNEKSIFLKGNLAIIPKYDISEIFSSSSKFVNSFKFNSSADWWQWWFSLLFLQTLSFYYQDTEPEPQSRSWQWSWLGSPGNWCQVDPLNSSYTCSVVGLMPSNTRNTTHTQHSQFTISTDTQSLICALICSLSIFYVWAACHW